VSEKQQRAYQLPQATGIDALGKVGLPTQIKLLHMWMRRQIIVISVIATNTADGRHLRRLLKLPPSKTF
jgi:hypothetical protein